MKPKTSSSGVYSVPVKSELIHHLNHTWLLIIYSSICRITISPYRNKPPNYYFQSNTLVVLWLIYNTFLQVINRTLPFSSSLTSSRCTRPVAISVGGQWNVYEHRYSWMNSFFIRYDSPFLPLIYFFLYALFVEYQAHITRDSMPL